MYLKKLTDSSEITANQLATFSRYNFSPLTSGDFALLDINDTAEKIAYSEEKKENSDKYFTEVNINGTFRYDGIKVCVKGVIGGVFVFEKSFIIDIVKSVKFPLELVTEKIYSSWISPAKCSAYLLIKARNLESIKLRLILVHPETLEKRKIEITYTKDELESFFLSLLSEWTKWTKLYTEHIKCREESLGKLSFPFAEIRDGQETIIKEVEASLISHKPLYINAPTGIGKTAAVLYPSLRAIGKENGGRIFYLTSKNSLHNVVINACKQMESDECKIRILSLVSKNKLCPSGKCNKKTCSNIAGHSERLKNALYSLVTHEHYLTYEVITKYAAENRVCPFELARHSAKFSDVIVCDYNYIFDPYVSRVDLFSGNGDDVLLIDEAHNLVERVKEMYSASLNLSEIEKLSDFFKSVNPEFSRICNKTLKIIGNIKSDDLFQSEPLDRNSVDNIVIEANVFFKSFQQLIESESFSECFLDGSEPSADDVLKLFNRVRRFVSLSSEADDNYILFFDERGNVRFSLVDTGKVIRTTSQKMGSAVFFSATLAPEEYYRHMLGAMKRDLYINLASPFPTENFKVISYNLSTRFSEREATLSQVVDVIYASVSSKPGNYMAFLPSYSYLQTASSAFAKKYPEINLIVEKPGMSALEKQEFVRRFESDEKSFLVGFCVMGGSFSEGVDFAGDSLLGAIIVGLGVLPPERYRELTAGYFNDRFFDGVKFAYVYPGMNKVFQAGGRVIRSETDKGFLVVIDDRFLSEDYLEHMPESWHNLSKARDFGAIGDILTKFWEE